MKLSPFQVESKLYSLHCILYVSHPSVLYDAYIHMNPYSKTNNVYFRIITNLASNSLFALPANHEFVYVDTGLIIYLIFFMAYYRVVSNLKIFYEKLVVSPLVTRRGRGGKENSLNYLKTFTKLPIKLKPISTSIFRDLYLKTKNLTPLYNRIKSYDMSNFQIF